MAIARDGSGELIKNTALPVRITIQTTPTGGTIVWQETHTSTTDNYGVMSLVIGTGTRTGGRPNFSSIVWGSQTLYIKTEIKYPVTNPTYTLLGSSQIWSVPYAIAADSLVGPLKKLAVQGATTNMEEALFEVKNKSGNTVFAVYNEGVRIYVDDGDAKGTKGGFAVSSQAGAKALPQDFLLVKKDTVRIYIDDSTDKGSKGGFAVGGFSEAKSGNSFFNVSFDETGIIDPAVNRILWYPLKNAFLTGNIRILNPADVGVNSFATGYQAKAKGQYSQSMGYLTQALGSNSTAIGKNSVASQSNSFALGDGAEALMADSYAFGAGARASGTGSYSIGSVGRDTATLLPNTQPTDAIGNYSFAIGMGATSAGIASTAIGVNSSSSGTASIALGVSSKASGEKASAIGAGEALGLYSFAAGYMSKAEGRNSVAIGYGINKPPKIVVYNHALGDFSLALGIARANGMSSVAIGSSTADAPYGYVIGHSSKVTGDYAMGFGIGLEVQSYMSTAMGMYNVVAGSKTGWNASDPFFVVGNGTSPSTTSNALTILKNGNMGIGVAAPTSKLHVKGTTATNSQLFMEAGEWNSTGDYAQIVLGDGNHYIRGEYAKGLTIYDIDGVYLPATWGQAATGGTTLYINSSGKIGTNTSSIRYKENVFDLVEYDWLYNLRPVIYNYKNTDISDLQYGLIAEEVDKVNPLLVIRNKDDQPDGMMYERLTVPMLKAIQDQKNEIDELKEKIKKLEELILQMENR
jgi:hypothetical protein